MILLSLPAFSQWGIVGGVNISKISDSRSVTFMTSGHIGGTYDFKLSKKWYFQPGVLFTSTGFNLKENLVLKGGHLRIYALELPLNLSFRPLIVNDIEFLLNFGLYTRYGLFGNKKYDYQNLPSIKGDPFDAYNRFEAGLNLGFGLKKNQYSGLLVFQRGLSEAQKDLEDHHQVIKLSLGYNF